MHWSEKIARRLIERNPEKSEYVCAAGISPSGSIHIGNFRDIATSFFVCRRIIVDEIENVLYIPIEALHLEGDKSYVFKKTVTGGYEKSEVQTGHTNTDYVIIESGLHKGDKVALVDPATLEQNEEKKKTEKQ